MKIPFSPPYIGKEEIEAVINVLESDWITTGPKNIEFEEKICEFIGCEGINLLGSATIGLETILRILGIGPGDEVIVPAYTYTVTASVVVHVGAKPIIVDINKNNFNISLEEVEKNITYKTKAIIPVDFGGYPVDYDSLMKLVQKYPRKNGNDIFDKIGRIVVIADAAHSFGSIYKGKKIGSKGLADFTVYSFHAVKNLTTAEGGAVVYNFGKKNNTSIYRQIKLWTLHGQTKDALEKTEGSWEYDVLFPGYKGNMTDIQAAIGIAQLKKYRDILKKKEKIYNLYNKGFEKLEKKGLIQLPRWIDKNLNIKGNFHLYPVLLHESLKMNRNKIIEKLQEYGVSTNVHFKPLPLLTAYKKLGYKIKNVPNSLDKFEREISLPIWSGMSNEEVKYVIDNFSKVINELG